MSLLKLQNLCVKMNLKEEKLAVLEDRSNTSTKYVVWHIEGGLGKNVAAGSLNSPDVNGLDMVCDTTKLAAITGNLVKSSATSKVAMYDGAAWTAIA